MSTLQMLQSRCLGVVCTLAKVNIQICNGNILEVETSANVSIWQLPLKIQFDTFTQFLKKQHKVSIVIFVWPFGVIYCGTLRVVNWEPLKPVLGGRRDVALFHFPSCTYSIKPSLNFQIILLFWMHLSDHTFFQNFNAMNRRVNNQHHHHMTIL
jgi:hypothetical protein